MSIKSYEIAKEEIIKSLKKCMDKKHHPIFDIIMKEFDPSFISDKSLILSDKIKPSSYYAKTIAETIAIENSLRNLPSILKMINVVDIMFTDENQNHIKYFSKIEKSVNNLFSSFESESVKNRLNQKSISEIDASLQRIIKQTKEMEKIKKQAELINGYASFILLYNNANENSCEGDIHISFMYFTMFMNIFMNIDYEGFSKTFMEVVCQEAISNKEALQCMYDACMITNGYENDKLCEKFINTFRKFSVYCLQLKMMTA